MNPDDSPFTPNQPASVDFFTGREEQVEELLGIVRKAATGTLQVAWIAGERGIGKSSLASLIGFMAEQHNNALVAHVHLGGVHELHEMVKQSYVSLLKDNQSKSWSKKLWTLFENKVRTVGVFGLQIELDIAKKDLAATARNFSESLDHILKNTGTDRKVLLLILDDINGLAKDPGFAHWLKSMVDGVATSKKEVSICLVFVGLQERLDEMRENNPSVIRSFSKIVEIKPWTETETKDFFKNAFSKKGIELGDSNIESLAKYSGGFPVLAHEFGDRVWGLAQDHSVNSGDVVKGIVKAVYSIGERFIEREIVQALGSENYKSILQKIGSASFGEINVTFSREQLLALKTFTEAEKKTLGNFLRRMIKVGGLVSVERGVYRFPTRTHRIYFILKAKWPNG